nr:3'-5' exonuclease [Dysgonomonas sp. 216]
MPIAQFAGRIIVVQTEKEADEAIKYLETFKRVGFDTETRPSFKKGKSHKIALMQISVDDTCFLFRLNMIGFPDSLSKFLDNPDILKIGLSLKDDFSAIRKRTSLEPQGFVELQSHVKDFGIEDASLQRIYAIIFNEKISKRQRLTNWENDVLTDAQKMYAALDAWACLRIYDELEKYRINN